MNTMTLFPSQYVEEAAVARPAALSVAASRPQRGQSRLATPVRRALVGAAAYVLILMGVGTELVTGIGILGLAVLVLALSIERYGAAMSLLAAANLAVTVILVHPELVAIPVLAAVSQLLVLLLLGIAEAIANSTAAMALRRADLGLLEGSV